MEYDNWSLLTKFEMPKSTYQEAKAEIARRIKEARLHSGLQQNDIARELHISQSSYSRMERGLIMPDIAQAKVLSGLHNVSILWLLGMSNYFVYVDQSSSSSPS